MRLGSIQILRGLAAALVVFSHILRIEHEQWSGTGVAYSRAFGLGDMGVYVFFVISGFIMYYTAGRDFGVPGSSGRFAIKRLVRIVPLYWIFTAAALVAPFSFGWRPAGLTAVATSFAFLPDAGNAPFFTPVLAVGWTLSFEMLFYLVFALCLMLPRRLGLPLLLGLFPVVLVAARLADHTSLARHAWWPLVDWWAGAQTLLFAAGVALGIAAERFGRVMDRRGVAVAVALLILLLVPTAPLFAPVPLSKWPLMFLATGIVALCVLSTGHRWDEAKPLVRLGDASYALYLSHAFVLGALSVVWLKVLGPHAMGAFACVALVASIGAAWLIHAYIEKPLTTALRNRFETRLRGSRPLQIPAV